MRSTKGLGLLFLLLLFSTITSLVILYPLPLATAIRPLVEDRLDVASSSAASFASPFSSWQDERLFIRRYDDDLGSLSPWNITGTYKGTWSFVNSVNASPKFLDFERCNGTSVFELVTTTTMISGVHYAQGTIIFQDAFETGHDQNVAQLRLEGVYIWPFRQLRLVANSGSVGEAEDSHFSSHPYHLLGIFSSQVFPESSRDIVHRKRKSVTYEIQKPCNLEIAAKVSQLSSGLNGGEHERYCFEGLMESPSVNGDGECFPPIQLNGTSLNIEAYYNKAVNYTLMVTFISFLQVLMLIRQMEHSNTQSGASKVSIVMIGQQAIMDAYLCLLHLTAGILIESLFNAFATAAFFKFVVFSIFEMRYLLAIWKASRPVNTGEGWETMRRELSVLYSRFYGILLGGILVMYELHNFMHPILFILYSFWLPQIVSNILHDTRKPLHPHYVIGITVTRLAIPFYVFGCPSNFMRIETDVNFCMLLGVYVGSQMLILLLQHYFGSRCFIPRQFVCGRSSFVDSKEGNPSSRFSEEDPISGILNGEPSTPDLQKRPQLLKQLQPGFPHINLHIQGPLAMEIRPFHERIKHVKILPEKYSYSRRLEVDPSQCTDCVICMTAIDLTQRCNDCMVTPCDHFFHTGCLQRWMDIKMECPTCRRPLPPA